MANTFSLAASGFTTVQLNDLTAVLTLDYNLPSADPRFEELDSLDDDPEITDPKLGTRTGSLRIMVQGGSETAVQNTLRSIERLLDAARYWRQTGVRVYFQEQLGNESDTWRTHILAGKLDVSRAANQLHTLKVEATIALTLRYYKEGPETAIDLTSSEDGTPASEVTFYINDNATPAATNWIGIAASEITGSLRAPLKLTLKNTSGGSVNWREFHVGHNVFSDPANFDPFLLGSEAEAGASDSWSNGADGTNLYEWTPATIGTARLTDCGGRMFRMLAAFTSLSVTGTAYFTLHVAHVVGSTFTSLWSSGEVAVDGADTASYEVLDFGSMPVPPGGFLSLAQIGIFMEVRAASSGSCVLDFLHLLSTDSYRKFVKFGFSDSNNDALVDDGISGVVYSEDTDGSPAGQYPIWTPLGKPIHVYPNKAQRLYVLTRESTGFVAAREMTAQASYRPRRGTV